VDIGDNRTAATHVSVPALVVHSVADDRIPLAEAESVVAAIPGRAALVRHNRRGHSAILTSSRPCDWAAVLTFVQTGALPETKVDTVDACAQSDDPAQTAAARDSVHAVGATTSAAPTSDTARPAPASKTSPPAKSDSAAGTKTKAPPSTKTKAPASKTGSGAKRP
jgi:hypothetical protein